MKNQYFGDNKDLFAYDLIYWAIRAGLAQRFTFVPMLTPPDQSTDGGKTDRRLARVGTGNGPLVSFLDDCVRRQKRDIRQLERFFGENEMGMTIYSGEEKYFSHRNRGEYFAGIKNELLIDSIIFVSPDIGLEVKNPNDKHMLFSEVRDLYSRMHRSSILMLIQNFPRRDHHDYLHERSEEIAEKVSGEPPLCIDDNQVAFFFLTRDEELEQDLAGLLEHYAGEYG